MQLPLVVSSATFFHLNDIVNDPGLVFDKFVPNTSFKVSPNAIELIDETVIIIEVQKVGFGFIFTVPVVTVVTVLNLICVIEDISISAAILESRREVEEHHKFLMQGK